MTRYERIVNMTIEEMAKENLTPMYISNGTLIGFSCSDGSYFSGSNAINRALEYEIKWLNCEPHKSEIKNIVDEL